MEKQALKQVLALQNKAYELLLWIDEHSRQQPELLDEKNIEAFRYAQSAQEWLRRMNGIFPLHLRVEETESTPFAHLFSAFFNTSFHVEVVNESDWHRNPHDYTVERRIKLVRGVASGRKTKAQKEKVAQSARNLQIIALEELAIEQDVDLSRAQIEALAQQPELGEALNLWAYAHELMRRSQFASQGAAVHALWNTMDKKTRQNLNLEVIWDGRERLVDALKHAV